MTGKSHVNQSKPTGGPLIPAATSAKFEHVVTRIVGCAPEYFYSYPVDKLQVPLAGVPDLLDQASEVLQGNPIAARRFRELLRSFGGGVVPTKLALHIFATHQNNRCRCGDMKTAHGKGASAGDSRVAGTAATVPFDNASQQLVSMERLEPVLAAAVYAARDVDELATLAGGLELGLAGADELNTLFDLALNEAAIPAVASAFNTAVRVSGFADFPPPDTFTPEEDDFNSPQFEPGLGYGPRTGSSWFEWPPPFPGGDPSPGGVPEIPDLDPSLIENFEQCMLFDVIPELHRQGIGFRELVYGVGTNYVIEEVQPDNACPGDTITIRGTNFEGTVAVCFIDSSGRTVSATPATVTSTMITVPLPAEAVSGPVWLHIPVTSRLCLSEQVLSRPGVRGSIRVGGAAIVDFELEGDPDCVARGSTVQLHWAVEPAEAEVRIVQMLNHVEEELAVGVEATGTISVAINETGRYRFRIEATNPLTSCGRASATFTVEARYPAPRIAIIGVEKTQAIQIFNLADPTAESNNSLELIANMDTVLRVYVSPVTAAARITGTLAFDGRIYHPINSPDPFINTSWIPMRIRTNDSLNFLIPAADASGSAMRATIRIFIAGDYCGDVEYEREEELTWVERPALPVTIRRVADSDGSVIGRRAALDLIRSAFRRMPSPMTAITRHPGVFQIQSGTVEDNYCHDGGYYQLALSVAYEHNGVEGLATDSHESSWVGLYWQFGCTVFGNFTSGMLSWPSTSTCISERDQQTAAHELMHTVGLGHTVTGLEDCENVLQPVACHRLPGRPTGRLRQVPFDIERNRAVNGAFDLMSYRGGVGRRWLSPELWMMGRRMMNSRY